MSERFKNMTINQLIDLGFDVCLSKYRCGKNPSLEAKQWLNVFYEYESKGHKWATSYNAGELPKLEVVFYGD